MASIVLVAPIYFVPGQSTISFGTSGVVGQSLHLSAST